MRKLLIPMLVVAVTVCFGFAGPAASAPKGGKKVVLLETSLGNIKIELQPEKAPVSVENFLKYVKNGHYDGTIFHRVIRDFMIQGGGFNEAMSEKRPAFPPIKNEAGNGLKNTRGAVAMARTNVVDSATAQFFINTVSNDFLNHVNETPRGFGYAVFGNVIEGMDVVDKIRAVPTGSHGMFDDVPKQPVVIRKATVVE